MQTIAIVAVFFGGTAGVWYGLVEDREFAMLLGFLGWVAATIATFNGGFALSWVGIRAKEGAPGLLRAPGSPDVPRAPSRSPAPSLTRSTLFNVVIIVAALALGTAGLWYGFVEDLKYVFSLGIIALAGATVVAFRGTVPR